MRVSLAAGLLFLALDGGPLSRAAPAPEKQLAAEASPRAVLHVEDLRASPQDGPTVVRGPYLQRGSPTSIVVRWRTDEPSDSRVAFGADPGSLSQEVDDPALVLEHEIELAGLSAGALYYYAVGTGTALLAGGDEQHFFRTPPAPGTPAPTRIWVLGDSGTADASAAAVRDAYYAETGARHTDLWLMLGDNAYPWGTDTEYEAAVFDMYPEMLRKSVLWPTIGNHDIFDGTANAWPYFDIFTLPTNAEAGGEVSATEAYYSFDHANAHFVVLDSQNSGRSPGSAMLTWLEADLQSTTQPWIIAYWHHPPYTKGSHDSDDPGDSNGSLVDMRENVLPILEDYGVDLVLTGHSHSYERSYLLDGHYGSSSDITDPTTSPFVLDSGDGSIAGDGAYHKPLTGSVPIVGPGNGAVYSVAGSAGQADGGPLDHPAMFVSLNVLGSLVIDLVDNRLDARFLDSTGLVRDEFTILKDCPAGEDDDEDLVCDARDNCPAEANLLQADTDSDGAGDACDGDNDGDGVPDGDDAHPLDPLLCRDVDSDSCDDCTSGADDPADDGADADLDGQCDAGDNCPEVANPSQTDTDDDGAGDACDGDDDGDGVPDGDDAHPLNELLCRDADSDTCDDCTSGTDAPANDGTDTDTDGLCNAGDPDDDNDAVPDGQDTQPLNKFICRDVDSDTCNDCVTGTSAPGSDGPDFDSDGLCNAGDSDDDDDNIPDGVDTQPLNKFICRDIDTDTCDDCTSGTSAPANDGTDTDLDGLCNAGDPDDDGDGVADGGDSQPLNKFVCRDSDADTCDDCTSGLAAPTNDGADTDSDGECDAGDNCDTTPNPTQTDTDMDGAGDACDGDDDGDGVPDGQDSQPLNRFACRDVDADTCDNCSSGFDARNADGTDTDTDGQCNAGDPDDNDAVPDGSDTQPLNKFICRDTDLDSCDDCTSGTSAPANDGTDTDLDGKCNAGDPDDDGDGVADGADSQPLNKFVCRDSDIDSCDDCTSGTDAPADDGTDTDMDGKCNAGDPDDDGDGVADGGDSQPLNRFICSDVDADSCDDCTSGTSAPAADGTDTDLDGLCNTGDPDDDNDAVADGQDMQPLNKFLCRDVDADSCDDCTSGTSATGNDGADSDTDGLCDTGDPDDDNDGVVDGQDSQPFSKWNCRDLDADTCDDCAEIPLWTIDAHFDASAEGFTYLDDAFGTNQPMYASGTWVETGALRVDLGGGIASVSNMSGAWRQTFSLSIPHRIIVSFAYNMTQTPHYDAGEQSDMLMSVDGVLHGTPPNSYVARLVGDGNGGPSKSTGWQTFQVDLGFLGTGTHTVLIGGFNNDKDGTNESTTLQIDDVRVQTGGGTGFADPSNDGLDTDTDGLCNGGDGDDDGDAVADGQDNQPLNKFLCRDTDTDGCDDCTSGTSSTSNDGTDTDLDGQCNTGDTDDDGDAVADGQDNQPLNKFLCRDTDTDGCDDCTSGTSSTSNDGTDTDLDGQCNTGDTDDDNDAVADGQDTQPLNKFICRDVDTDGCDDCTSGTSSTSNDGTDTDLDGQCNTGDTDDDNDAVPDGQDTQPLNKFICRDTDLDLCDDCTSGTSATSNDGTDTDLDGLCNTGDPDDDNDAVPDGQDTQPLNKFICRDVDTDGCDDCVSGTSATSNDGTDTDLDGLCNTGDPDDDNDAVADGQDNQPLNKFVCRDTDTDGCDDCVSGTSATSNDGTDTDLDGLCNTGDPDDDNDAVPDGQDTQPLNKFLCRDTDLDLCDDCTSGTSATSNDGTDTDSDGECNAGDNCDTVPNPSQTDNDLDSQGDACDPDDDNDAVEDGQDTQPLNKFICRDTDLDLCDDCVSGTSATSNDGTDTDTDGLCNTGDPDDDNDAVADGQDTQPLNQFVCRDTDTDGCDDCVSGTSATSNDGTDTDTDGLCNTGDPDDDNDAVADGQDTQPLNQFVCRDMDLDLCDDCTSGTSATSNDGLDTDTDGLCNTGDLDDDNDAVQDAQDAQPLNAHACRDLDMDTCDDCSIGTDAPGNDGPDQDSDGKCDAGDNCVDVANPDQTDTDLDGQGDVCDADDDGDTVADVEDAAPLDRFSCRDVDEDGCDDCTSSTDDPANDGPDWDADGACDKVDPEILLEHLLDEMVDLEGLTRMPAPPYVTAQASSYDRASDPPCVPGQNCWFANFDLGHFQGSQALPGRTEYVLLDVDGPGVVTRIWSAAPQGTLRVYIDGNPAPEIEAGMSQLLFGAAPPFVPPLARGTPGNAGNLYFPIPYSSHCRITTDDSAGGNPATVYYHVDYRTYPQGTSIESFTMERVNELADRIDEIAEVFVDPSLAWQMEPGEQVLTGQILPGGAPVSVPAPGPLGGVVRELRLTPSRLDPAALRSTLLTMTFDGTTTVQAPLGDFFGSGPGLNPYQLNPYKSLPMSVEADGTLVSRWPMPFEQGMSLQLSGAPADLTVSYEILVQPFEWSPGSLYFSASWRADHVLTAHDERDLTLVSLTGTGRYLGNTLNVTSPFFTIWWGEGDERIRVDGESFPSHFGTGTEDYYGFGFAAQLPFEHAYHNQTSTLGPGFHGRNSTNRWHVLDSIPFQEELRFDLEQAFKVSSLYKKAQLFDSVVYWYGAPGTTHDHPTLSPSALTLPEPGVLLPKSIPGTVVEGEQLSGGSGAGVVGAEEMTPYEDQDNLWSEHRQMAWIAGSPGGTRQFGFNAPLPAPGVYRVTLHTTKSPTSGMFSFSMNGAPSPLSPLDLWNDGEVLQHSAVLGSFSLTPGNGTLAVTLLALGESSGSAFGLDALSFEPFDDDQDGMANDVDNCPVLSNPTQLDSDGDDIGNPCDLCPFDANNDLDQDGVCGDLDSAPANPHVCRDMDADGCDDCTSGFTNLANDGPDPDGDGFCNVGDLDDDGDGVGDSTDSAPLDPLVCRDLDLDGCDDCTSGVAAPGNDGLDTDADGTCNVGDPEDDGDGVVDGLDWAPLLASACRDLDSDACDDCTSGTDDPASDGPDGDGDGHCDASDPQDDSDGEVLLSGGATALLSNSADPGVDATWFTAGFVPGPPWQSGSFGVGYETDPPGSGAQALIATAVPAGVRSVYTRTAFEVADPEAIFSLFLGADYDDGLVAWINGIEVYRSPEMRDRPLSWNTLAEPHESSNGSAPDFAPLRDIGGLGMPALQQGTNVLAIGVWNDAPGSHDLVLFPRLVANRRLIRQPYLQRQTSNSVVLCWRTALATDSKVSWGIEFGSLTSSEVVGGSRTDHEVTINGLASNTRYYYSVGSSTELLAGGDSGHTFLTPPLAGVPRPTRMWIVGDSGQGLRSALDVRDAYFDFVHHGEGGLVGARPTDLWLLLGDNAAPDGTDAQYQESLFDVHASLLRTSAVWPALGDRDGYDGTQGTWPHLDAFTLPTAGEAGGVPSGTERYYSFDHANVHVVVLDSTVEGPELSGMASWLASDLDATNQQWILAAWHHPPYSKGSHDSDDPQDSDGRLVAMRETIVPILEDYGVDLVLAAHSQSYERSFLIDGHYSVSSSFVEGMKLDGGSGSVNGPDGPYLKEPRGETPYGPAAGDGTVYVVAGSSSVTATGQAQSLGGTEPDHPAMHASLLSLGSVVIDVDGNRLDARFLTDDGAIADEFTIFKGGAPAVPVAEFGAEPRIGPAGLAASFLDLSQNGPTAWSWDFENDGIADAHAPNPVHVYDEPGLYTVRLAVSNSAGADEIVKPNFVCVSAGVPGPVVGLRLTADRKTMVWTAEPIAMFYDVVRGDLNLLRSTGSFPSANPTCIEQDGFDLTASDTTLPVPGQALFYLVRGSDCMNPGTFDTSGSGQAASRDPGLAGVRCPGCGVVGDGDGDGVCDAIDNCIAVANPDQDDADGDTAGNACDACPSDPADDPDMDDVCAANDNCPSKFNPNQQDSDGDTLGNACDVDDDGDGVPDALDSAPLAPLVCRDADADGCDDCSSGTDAPEDDGADADSDGICDAGDNCDAAPNPSQTDTDADGQGDACDTDDDGDGVADGEDTQPLNEFLCRDTDLDLCDDCTSGTSAPASDGTDTDTDGLCDTGDPDDDGDGVADGEDNQPLDEFLCRDVDDDSCDDCTSGTSAPSNDGTDTDADGICNAGDNCPLVPNPGQQDSDEDGIGNACDPVDVYPSGEQSVTGSAVGTYLATLTSNDVAEVLTEEGGLTSALEHRWTIVVAPGSAKTLRIEGFRSQSSDGDDFAFEYSTNGTSWSEINLPSLPLQDNDTALVGTLPAGLVGPVQIRVMDTNRELLALDLDTVSIDELFVRSEP